MCTVPGTDLLLQPLEEAVRHQFLLAVTGRHGVTELDRDLLALPARHSGLGVLVPTRNQFKACTEVTAPLMELIHQQKSNYPKLSQQKQR